MTSSYNTKTSQYKTNIKVTILKRADSHVKKIENDTKTTTNFKTDLEA